MPTSVTLSVKRTSVSWRADVCLNDASCDIPKVSGRGLLGERLGRFEIGQADRELERIVQGLAPGIKCDP